MKRCLLLLLLLVLAGCKQEVNPRVATRLNDDASVAVPVPGNHVITSWVDRGAGTMSTLLGNDAASAYAQTHVDAKYPAGAVLTAVTWKQQEDPRWFGGRMPASTQSMEVVTVQEGGLLYQRYAGHPLAKAEGTPQDAARAAWLLNQRAAVMP